MQTTENPAKRPLTLTDIMLERGGTGPVYTDLPDGRRVEIIGMTPMGGVRIREERVVGADEIDGHDLTNYVRKLRNQVAKGDDPFQGMNGHQTLEALYAFGAVKPRTTDA
jgi:hypothetical protein